MLSLRKAQMHSQMCRFLSAEFPQKMFWDFQLWIKQTSTESRSGGVSNGHGNLEGQQRKRPRVLSMQQQKIQIQLFSLLQGRKVRWSLPINLHIKREPKVP